MNKLVRFLLISALLIVILAHATAVEDSKDVEVQLHKDINQETITKDEGRGLASNIEINEKHDDGVSESESQDEYKMRGKPRKNIFMGIYKNYKSTYLGNKTTSEYKKKLRERLSTTNAPPTNKIQEEPESGMFASVTETVNIVEQEPDPEELNTEIAPTMEAETEATLVAGDEKGDYETNAIKKRRKRKRKNRIGNRVETESTTKIKRMRDTTEMEVPLMTTEVPEQNVPNDYQYNVGPGLNVSLDMYNEIVHVKLDGDNLKEIIAARWLNDDLSEEGRGKKYEMVTKVLPLFILPFLIQSAIVPFLVTKLKLLLVKSILVGKLAIFLLIISAIRNSNKVMQSYEVAPSYWANEPSRRSELAAAASSSAYSGYRVEGKPTTWIN